MTTNNKDTRGIIFDIQKFSIHDGPGIRTTAFLKGCPLTCLWCHNPESQDKRLQVLYKDIKCTLCRKCEAVCEMNCHKFINGKHLFDQTKCTRCGLCTKQCPASALTISGYEVSVDDVMKEVLKDKAYYEKSGGGITISGGEPMVQYDFTRGLLKKSAEEKIQTCLETCGYAKLNHYMDILEYVDIFLFDYKETAPQKHKNYTGVTNDLILNNLFEIDKAGNKTFLRCPVIPGYNDTTEHFIGIAQTANKLKNIQQIDVLPYHPMGKSKSEAIGKSYSLNDSGFPKAEEVHNWTKEIKKHTHVNIAVVA